MKPSWLEPRTPINEAQRELREAELGLLQAYTAKEYASSVIAYREAQVIRLRKYIAASKNL